MILVLLGPPGVGKGTQGELVAGERGWRRIATGDLLRVAVRGGTELGRRAKCYMDAGELVPDELIVAMVREALAGADADGVVFDGFPRTEAQAAALDEVLDGLRRPVDRVLVFEAPEPVVVRRLSGRRSCPSCGAVYNVYLAPPREDERCERCGSELARRSDDEPETVRRRLAVYREETAPLIAYYERRGAEVLRVAADGTVEEVRCRVREALGRTGSSTAAARSRRAGHL
ncbi:MAG: adenylate kinase [Gemmatimonadetes bacterium]|nr:adenylate kinase [Gemmatimonadota bacterium]